MWDKYGEFNSAEEINQKAAELYAEGKKTELMELAEENGIDKEMAEYYGEGIDFLCDDESAAVGKLDVELANYEKQYKANAIEVSDALKSMMSRDRIKFTVHRFGVDIDIDIKGLELAKAIRRKGKSLNAICKDVFTKAQKIHVAGNPASALVVPMIIEKYME